MTHTCCELGISSWIGPSFAEPSPWHLKPRHWRQSAGYDIREWALFDQDEYQTAGDGIEELFEELMVEFEREISSLSPSAEAFEHFLWGFWRQRISEVFAVDQGYLVRYLFDLDFDLIKYTIKTTVEGAIEYHTEEGERNRFDAAFFLRKKQQEALNDEKWHT
ncbi:hypothetical protein NW759_013926 [Fusarium solani]|nr:hypothetical protein NW759_013926 [Fusarium solani]